MASRIVTGTILKPDNTPWKRARVQFDMKDDAFTLEDTYPQGSIRLWTDALGNFSVPLAAGLSVYWVCKLPDHSTFEFALEDGPPITIETLQASAGVPPVPPSILDELETVVDASMAEHVAEVHVPLNTLVAGKANTSDLANYSPVTHQHVGAGANSVALGTGALAAGARAISIGLNPTASAQQAIAIGESAQATFTTNIAIGASARATAANAAAIGGLATATFAETVAIGESAAAEAIRSTAIGRWSWVQAGADNGLALGYNALVNPAHVRSIALGANASTSAADTAYIKANDTQLVRSNGTGVTRLGLRDSAGAARLVSVSTTDELIVGTKNQVARANHTGTQLAATISDFSATVSAQTDVAANTAARHTHSNKATLDAITAAYTTAEATKLAGIATGATANSPDATLLARANHTGTQLASTVSDFATAVGTTAAGVAAKTTPVDADTLPLTDSAASNALKKLTWANLKTALGTVFAALDHWHPGVGTNSTSVGSGNNVTGTRATAFGGSVSATYTDATVIGFLSAVTGINATAVGKSSTAAANSTAIGAGAIASASATTAIGPFSEATASGATAIGNSKTAYGARAMSIGGFADAPDSVAIGDSADIAATATEAISIGSASWVSGISGISIGGMASVPATSPRSIALGKSANVPANTPDRGIFRVNDLEVQRSNGTGISTLQLTSPDSTVGIISVTNTDDISVNGAAAAKAATLAASGKGFINHGATAGTTRPTGYASIEWMGSVEPTNMANGDTWIQTA